MNTTNNTTNNTNIQNKKTERKGLKEGMHSEVTSNMFEHTLEKAKLSMEEFMDFHGLKENKYHVNAGAVAMNNFFQGRKINKGLENMRETTREAFFFDNFFCGYSVGIVNRSFFSEELKQLKNILGEEQLLKIVRYINQNI